MACRTERPKRELTRIVRTPAGEVLFDLSGRSPGRGAYLCADGSCWRNALKKSAIERALGVVLPDDVRAGLERGEGITAQGGVHGA